VTARAQWAHAHPLIGRPVAPRRAASASARLNIDGLITALLLLATVLMCTVSSSLLGVLKIHYATLGGAAYEKLHPATYVLILTFMLSLFRNGDPIAEIDRFFGRANLILIYLICTLALLAQSLAQQRPFAVIMDTFLLPLLFAVIAWRTPPRQRWALVWAVHATVFINVCLAYYEYFSGHRIVPLMLGDNVMMGEWRATALLGHPLAASSFIGAYIIALMLRPSLIPWPALRFPFILFCLGSLACFGGRTAMILVALTIVGLGIVRGFGLLRGERVSLPVILIAFVAVFTILALVLVAFDSGLFDKAMLRFSSDKGSAATRLASLKLLGFFGWSELILGPDPARARSLQSLMGLDLGIENFWVSSIVQFGIASTALITLGLGCFFAEVLRRSHPAAWALVLFIVVVAASSVSFSSKNTYLAQYVALIAILLPRAKTETAGSHVRPMRAGHIRLPAR